MSRLAGARAATMPTIGCVARTLALGAALCCAMAAAPGAQAASRGIPANESFIVTGSVTYSWHGDPARGCARAGLCSVIGSNIFRADGSGGGEALNGQRQVLAVDATGTSTVRVRRGTVGFDGSGDCTEVDGSADVSLEVPGRARMVALGPGSLSSGRCAGPTSADLGRVRIPARVSGTRLRTVDLRAREPFTAGPFRGELVSSLVLRPYRSGSASSRATLVGVGPPPERKRLVEFVDLRYRVASLPSSIGVSFAGAGPPVCAVLDSCRVAGSLALSLVPYQGTLRLLEARAIRRPVRRSRAISDLQAGRLAVVERSLTSDGAVSLLIGEAITRGGAPDCSDAVALAARSLFGPSLSFDDSGAATVRAALIAPAPDPFSPTGDMVRTHCAGPTTTDVFGRTAALSGPVASGVIPVGRLLDRRLAVSLASTGRFRSFRYAGSRRGSIRLSLTRLSVRAGTERLRLP